MDISKHMNWDAGQILSWPSSVNRDDLSKQEMSKTDREILIAGKPNVSYTVVPVSRPYTPN